MKDMNSNRYIRNQPIPRLDQVETGNGTTIIGSDHIHHNMDLLNSLTIIDGGIVSDPTCDPNIVQEDW